MRCSAARRRRRVKRSCTLNTYHCWLPRGSAVSRYQARRLASPCSRWRTVRGVWRPVQCCHVTVVLHAATATPSALLSTASVTASSVAGCVARPSVSSGNGEGGRGVGTAGSDGGGDGGGDCGGDDSLEDVSDSEQLLAEATAGATASCSRGEGAVEATSPSRSHAAGVEAAAADIGWLVRLADLRAGSGSARTTCCTRSQLSVPPDCSVSMLGWQW